jgi:uncharacterized protein HemX
MDANSCPTERSGATEVYKALTVVCVIAIIALGTSVFSAVIQRSETAKQSKQIAAISNDVASSRHELADLRTELHSRETASEHGHGKASEHRPAEREPHRHIKKIDDQRATGRLPYPLAAAASVRRDELRERG